VATWTLWTLRSSWVEWSAWIDVDAEGLRWHEGGETYRILWDAVARLEVEGGEHPVVALALKQGGRAPLPFTTPALYRVLKDRFGPLPPVEENRMGLR
jgi:hypothetical protein